MARLERTELGWDLTPEAAATLVRGDDRPFALVGRWAGAGALVGSEPVRVSGPGDDPFALLEEQPEVEPGAPAGAVGGGWVGYLGYGLGHRLERLDEGPPRPEPLPDAALAYYDHLLRLDQEGRWWFECLWTPERSIPLERRREALSERVASPRPFTTAPWRASPATAGHERAVAACRERVHQGDLFQANVGLRLSSRLEGDPLDLFARGAAALRPDRAAFVAGPWGAVASLSPELFLERRGRSVRSAPIKGTAPRPADPEAAGRERDRLASSEKDRAENTMIVDLVRNDLGRVCAPGTVEVQALAEVRAHAGVWHLVSEVAGELAPAAGDGDLVRACFPPGSVTGAPKIAALNAIAELESSGREVYTGAIGLAGPLVGLELSVAIRTFELREDRIWLGVGGGVVADSDPAAEARECAVKAAPLLAAIGGEMAPAAAVGSAAPLLRLGPRPVPRPDPAAGVFETLLVREGEPVALEQHLARLAASVAALYGAPLAADLGMRIRTAAEPHDLARLRVDWVPGRDAEIATAGLTLPRPAPSLVPVTVPGGLGDHKWVDRALVDALTARTAPALPLLCDVDGYVLESVRANVMALEADGGLTTPPLDGRVLPGVTRAAVLEAERAAGREVREVALSLDRLRAAREVWLTGSLGGVEPVASIG